MEKCVPDTNPKPKLDTFQCKICPYNTLRRPYLDKHMQEKHGFSKVKPDNPQGKKKNIIKRKSKEKSGSNDVVFKCEMCNYKAKTNFLLNRHIKTHGSNEGEIYQCTRCNFKTTEVSALRAHETIHKKVELFECPKCDYASRHKRNFKAHLDIHGDSDKSEMFSCKFCSNFTTYHRSSLFKHISQNHKGLQKIFECEKCPYVTPNKSHMTAHRNIHTDPADLPTYHCDTCDFETHNEVTIRRHVKKHKEREERGEELIIKEIDGKTELVWFCCDLCEFRSKDQRYVILHKKVHARTDEINRIGEEIVFGKNTDVNNDLGNNVDNEATVAEIKQ